MIPKLCRAQPASRAAETGQVLWIVVNRRVDLHIVTASDRGVPILSTLISKGYHMLGHTNSSMHTQQVTASVETGSSFPGPGLLHAESTQRVPAQHLPKDVLQRARMSGTDASSVSRRNSRSLHMQSALQEQECPTPGTPLPQVLAST